MIFQAIECPEAAISLSVEVESTATAEVVGFSPPPKQAAENVTELPTSAVDAPKLPVQDETETKKGKSTKAKANGKGYASHSACLF